MPSLIDRLASFFRPERVQAPADADQKALDEHKCPDCGSIHLIGGPRGGLSQNIACADCLSEFCVINYFGSLKLLNRMGKLSAERAKLYGIQSGTA